MTEAEIRFERENLEGIVPVGTYLSDAARRFGIRFDDPCSIPECGHGCSVTVTQGIDLLSPMTAAESEYFEANERGTNERLACQARIESAGEIVVMTKEKKAAESEEETYKDKSEHYKKEFAEMPLEAKIASLVQLEAMALGETVSFILNSPYAIFDKVMDVMAEFGFKKEEAAKQAERPEEHRANGDTKEKGKPAAKRARKTKDAE